ncbi:MAG: hypothetical protein V1918_06025 [Planctomycetota bacterium]
MRRRRREKINPLYLLIAVVIFLPIVLVLPRYRSEREKRPDYIPWRLNWLRVSLPGNIIEAKIIPQNGVRYISAADGENEVIVVLIPIAEGSKNEQDIKEGFEGATRFFLRLFPTERMTDVECRYLPNSETYVFASRREEDRWHMASRMRYFPNRQAAVLVRVLSRSLTEARATVLRVYYSMEVKWGEQYTKVVLPKAREEEPVEEPPEK